MAEVACKNVRVELTDARGNRAGLSRQALDHLDTCLECTAFAALLSSLTPAVTRGAPDYALVDQALLRAQAILERRAAHTRFALFAAAATCITAGLVAAGALGYGLSVLAVQGAAFFTLPFFGLHLLRRRAKGETA